MSKPVQFRNSGTWPPKYWDRERRPPCLQSVGVAPIPTGEVVADRSVFCPTLELEQTSLKELRFRMRDIGPFLDLQLEIGHVVQANWKMKLRIYMVQLNLYEVVL